MVLGVGAKTAGQRHRQACHQRHAWAAWLGAAALLVVVGCGGSPVRPVEARSSVYVRGDSDHTLIVSPRATVAAEVAPTTRVDAGITVDAWSGASVDIVSAATGRVTERREEANLNVLQTVGRLVLGAGARYSTEPDYRSIGATLRGAVELARRNTTLALDAFGARDDVGRAGDPGFDQPLTSVGARATWAQVLDAHMVGELSWESLFLEGFQESPYRWVAIGGVGTCAAGSPLCVPESVPQRRWRHAGGARIRRALGERVSAGLATRLYADSWGVRSVTVEPDVALLVGDGGTLGLRFRYYTQGEASFYQPRYLEMDALAGAVTRDRKLSAFYAYELATSYEEELELDDGTVLTGGLRASVGRLHYQAFVGLSEVDVLELTTSLGLRFP